MTHQVVDSHVFHQPTGIRVDLDQLKSSSRNKTVAAEAAVAALITAELTIKAASKAHPDLNYHSRITK